MEGVSRRGDEPRRSAASIRHQVSPLPRGDLLEPSRSANRKNLTVFYSIYFFSKHIKRLARVGEVKRIKKAW